MSQKPIKNVPNTEEADEALMLRYINGEERAFLQLYNRYKPKVYGYFLRRAGGDRVVAEELFQLSFLKLHQVKHKYRFPDPLAPWFFVICKHILFDHFRKNNRTNYSHEEINENTLASPVLENDTASIDDMTKSLPEKQRDALKLRFESDLDFDEIAKRMGVSDTNARQIVSRAFRSLRVSLKRSKI